MPQAMQTMAQPAGDASDTKDAGGAYLYRVTTLRAEPGKLLELIELLVARRSEAGSGSPVAHAPVIMRHSQGDQWDLLLMVPMGSYARYYGGEAPAGAAELRRQIADLSAFREDLFAYGPPPATVLAAYADNDFFHIEMFMALAGRKDDLIEERRMENAYLQATGQRTNLIWTGDAGSDVDAFTVGFYPSIVEFAAPAPVSDAAAESAAVEAGFAARGAISTYLRELISGHHDTLAVKVK